MHLYLLITILLKIFFKAANYETIKNVTRCTKVQCWWRYWFLIKIYADVLIDKLKLLGLSEFYKPFLS